MFRGDLSAFDREFREAENSWTKIDCTVISAMTGLDKSLKLEKASWKLRG